MITIEFTDGRTEEMQALPVRDILKRLNLKETTTLVLMDGELLTQDVYIRDGQKIKIVNVVSGG